MNEKLCDGDSDSLSLTLDKRWALKIFCTVRDHFPQGVKALAHSAGCLRQPWTKDGF